MVAGLVDWISELGMPIFHHVSRPDSSPIWAGRFGTGGCSVMNVDSEIVLVEGRTYEAPRVAKRDLSTVRSSEVVPWAWDGDHRAATPCRVKLELD